MIWEFTYDLADGDGRFHQQSCLFANRDEASEAYALAKQNKLAKNTSLRRRPDIIPVYTSKEWAKATNNGTELLP